MDNRALQLINDLISVAKSQGLTQNSLAEKVGITPVSLSRAKGRGDIRLSTFVDLAHVLDLELALVPRQRDEKSINAIKSGQFFRIPSDNERD
jgi:transcriptional regulator with XRE-family HTH domain